MRTDAQRSEIYYRFRGTVWEIKYIPTNPVTSKWIAHKLGGISVNSHSQESLLNIIRNRM